MTSPTPSASIRSQPRIRWGPTSVLHALADKVVDDHAVVMRGLEWACGYPLALGVMALACLTPYLYFKRRDWL